MMNIFDPADAEALIARIERLTPQTPRQWGKMTVGQMLAHCSKPFDTIFDPEYAKMYPRPNALVRSILRLFLKPIVVGEKPYKRNTRTAPEFIVDDERDVDVEKARLVGYVRRVHEMGAGAFEGKESHSFGPLTAKEWSILFYKHTDHHLTQFGV